MAKRFSLNLSLLPSSSSSSSSLPLASPSLGQRQESTSPAPQSTQQQQWNPDAGILSVQREDLHRQLRSLENLLQQLSSYQLLLASLGKTEHKLSKASLELLAHTGPSGTTAGAGEVIANSLSSASKLFEALSEVTTKHAKLVSKEVGGLNSALSKHFKTLSKLEKGHDAHLGACDAKIKASGAKYEKTVKEAGKIGRAFGGGGGGAMEVGQKHEKWIGTLKALGEEIMGSKEQHQVQTSHLQTLALLSTSASITSLANSQFTASNEGVKRTAASVGEVQRWRGLAEAGWIGAGGIDELELASVEAGMKTRRDLEEDEDDNELHPPRRMNADDARGDFRRSESPVDLGTPTGSIPPNYSSYVGTPTLGGPSTPGLGAQGQGSSNYFSPQTSKPRSPIPADISDQQYLEPPQPQARALPPLSPSSQSKAIPNAGDQRPTSSSRIPSPTPLQQSVEAPLSPASLKIQQHEDQVQQQKSRPFYVRNPTSERTLVNTPPSPPPAVQQPQQQPSSTIRIVDSPSSARLAPPPPPQLTAARPTARASTSSPNDLTSPTSSRAFSPETPLDSLDSWNGSPSSPPQVRGSSSGGFFGLGLGGGGSSSSGGILSRGGNQSSSSSSNGSSSSNFKPRKTVRLSTGGVEVIGHSFAEVDEDEDDENQDAFEEVRGAGGSGGRLLTDWEASERREREQSLREKERKHELDRRDWERERERERERESVKEKRDQEGEKVRGIRSKLQEDARRHSTPILPRFSQPQPQPSASTTSGGAPLERRVSLLAQRFDSPAPSPTSSAHHLPLTQPRSPTPITSTHASRPSFSFPSSSSYHQETTRPLSVPSKPIPSRRTTMPAALEGGGRGGEGGDRSVQSFSQISQMANGGGFLLEEYEDGQDRRFEQQQGSSRRWD